MEANHQKALDRGIALPDYLIDGFWGDPTPENLLSLLRQLPEGTSELVFHLGVHESAPPGAEPAVSAPHGIDGNYLLMRELELFCITSPQFSRWLQLLSIGRTGFPGNR